MRILSAEHVGRHLDWDVRQNRNFRHTQQCSVPYRTLDNDSELLDTWRDNIEISRVMTESEASRYD